MQFTISSTAFQHDGAIPALYTCDGKNLSPPLSWSGVPTNAKSLVLIIDDPDATRTTWVHWVLYNIPPSTHSLPEGVAASSLPYGTLQGKNDWQKIGYGGPCPPMDNHHYFHKLIALDTVLPDLKSPTKAALEAAMQGHIISRTELIGRYQRQH